MRERLIELLDLAFLKSDSNFGMPSVNQVADYLLENGVIVPPVKVGQAVYIIDEPDFEDDYVLEVQVDSVGKDVGGVWVSMDLPLGMKRSGYIGACEIGRSIFLTREEAEKALKEREKT